MAKAIIVDISPVKASPSLTGMGNIFEAMTKVKVPSELNMSAGRLIANDQLMVSIPDKVTRDFVLMNLMKHPDGR